MTLPLGRSFWNWLRRVKRLPIRWMTVEQVGKWRSDKLLVSPAIKRTDVTDFATIDNEAEDLGLPAASCRATLPLA